MLRKQFNFLAVVEVVAMVVKVAKNFGHCSMDTVQEVQVVQVVLAVVATGHSNSLCRVGEARNFHCLELEAYLCLEFVAADSTLVAELAAVALQNYHQEEVVAPASVVANLAVVVVVEEEAYEVVVVASAVDLEPIESLSLVPDVQISKIGCDLNCFVMIV